MPVQNRIFRQTEWDKPWIYLQLFRKKLWQIARSANSSKIKHKRRLTENKYFTQKLGSSWTLLP